MIDTLNARSIHYIYLSIDDLRKAADQVLEIPSEVKCETTAVQTPVET